MGASQAEQDLKALEAFLVGNRDLERLEALLDRFNILEALGVVRQELRHSDFLRFLLDPRNPHGLGDAFVKRLLQRALMVAGDVPVPVTPIELELWDLGRVEVRREWNHIDILLLDEDHNLAVIVENKIGTREHSDQLRRYYRIVEEHHPDWRIVAVYLTPGGDLPTHEAYLPVDYGLVCEVMDGLAEDRASVVNPDLKTLMVHYTDMMRRNVLSDSDVARLSRLIYQKHRRALDLIYEHLPDVQEEIRELVESLVEDDPRFWFHPSSGKSKIKFGVEDWDAPALKWMMWFEVWNYPGSLEMLMFVGPGDEETRQRLFDVVRGNPSVFEGAGKLGPKWSKVFNRPWLEEETYDDADQAALEDVIRKRWAEFLEKDLPRIDGVLKGEPWIWEPDGSGGPA